MISYRQHVEHMRYAASRIENPQGVLYKQISTFIKNIKKGKTAHRAPWGRVLSFMYTAKFARKLPYYDRYPMSLIIKANTKKGYFDGFNLHYINPYFRTLFLRGLAHIYTSSNNRYLMREFQEATSRLVKRISRPLVHRYRFDHVKNIKFLTIPGLIPEHLGSVQDQTFMKAGLRKVWIESMIAIVRGAKWKLKRQTKKKAAAAAKRHMEAHKKAAKSSTPPKPRRGKPVRKSVSARNSKASTGKRYGRKRK